MPATVPIILYFWQKYHDKKFLCKAVGEYTEEDGLS